MKTTHILIALGLALLAQTTIVPAIAGGGAPVDLVLIVVVFAALPRGPIAGLWTGTLAGLLQDALSGGIVGVSGLAKTIVGVLAGVGGSRFILGTIWHRMTVLIAASFLHSFCYIGVYSLISSGSPVSTMRMVAIQAVVNATVGVSALAVVRLSPGVFERLRHGRNPMGRRRWIMS